MPRPVGGVIRKGEQWLSTLEEWRRYAPPKQKHHWKDGRSAKANARLWLGAAPYLPSEIEETLRSCDGIEKLLSWSAEPEAKVPFDAFRGPAHIDLLLTAEDEAGPLVIGIEAKADESFNDTIETTHSRARDVRRDKPGSRRVDRLKGLASLFGLGLDEPATGKLRYQLLTLTAAVLAEADRQSAKRAVVLVHEFVSRLTTVAKRDRNARDLDRFMEMVVGHTGSLRPGMTAGPFAIKEFDQLYYGKMQTTVGESGKFPASGGPSGPTAAR